MSTIRDVADAKSSARPWASPATSIRDLGTGLGSVLGRLPIRRIALGGVAVDLCEKPDFMEIMRRALRTSEGPALLVGSVNLDHVHHFGARTGARHRAIGRGKGWLMLVDGMPPVWAARRATGVEYPRLAGSDLLPEVMTLAAGQGRSVAFLGGTQDTVDQLGAVLAADFPDLTVTGHWIPERADILDPVASRKLAAEIKASGADLLVVGLGKPRQELWAAEFGSLTGARAILAFGASADFLAGIVHRAPDRVRDSGFEWLYRLVHEPRRLASRYLVQGPMALGLLTSRTDLRSAGPIGLEHLIAAPEAERLLISETLTEAETLTAGAAEVEFLAVPEGEDELPPPLTWHPVIMPPVGDHV